MINDGTGHVLSLYYLLQDTILRNNAGIHGEEAVRLYRSTNKPWNQLNSQSNLISPELLLSAYSRGFFPMAEPDGEKEIFWYDPDPRAILELDSLRISRSLRKTIRNDTFSVSVDHDFASVIEGCADRDETWISKVMMDSYLELHRLGYAHSVECRIGTKLVGGLYGVGLAGLFCGESMFSLVSDASKVGLVHLVRHLKMRGYVLLDIQMMTPHMEHFGAIEVSRHAYQYRLKMALQKDVLW
jgi:leucyl/phenylalanyl-tRNA---protein transferase